LETRTRPFALIAVEFISRSTIAIEPQQAPERHDLSLSAAQVAVHAAHSLVNLPLVLPPTSITVYPDREPLLLF
jgi:ABC-type molybdate transport system permease subunit